MVAGREASPQAANLLLSKVFQTTTQHLDAFQQLTSLFEGIINQQGEWGMPCIETFIKCPGSAI